jgi:hypothetical protein
MTEHDILKWIKVNLGATIDKALTHTKEKTPNLIYSKDWLAGMAMRETGFKIAEFTKLGKKPEAIHAIMRGDYGQRKGEKEKSYHGFGYWQIDIGSYPDFVKSGDWKDPFKTCCKAIAVLEEKRLYLEPRFSNLQGDSLHRAITAAYNAGQGNIARVLNEGKDIDARTYNHDYSAEVWRFRQIFNSLQQPQ